MAEEISEVFVYEEGRFSPIARSWDDALDWSGYLQSSGYADTEQVWGAYPNVYLKVYEASPDSKAEFRFAAVLTLVVTPYRVFVRDLNGLLQLISALTPLFSTHHSRPEQAGGEALGGLYE